MSDLRRKFGLIKYRHYICVKFTRFNAKTKITMNIMEILGFSKKGATKQSQPISVSVNADRELSSFSDRYPRAEKETRIFNLIILDESGSMGDIRQQALTGVNETISTIRAAQQENPDDHQMLSFVTFDQGPRKRPDVRLIIDNEKIENVEDLKPEQYDPQGMTPLYDAMGKAITALQKLVQDGDHVLVTVVTDGYENASHHYSAEMIRELVTSLSAKGWVFTYIGANQNSTQTAQGLGIKSAMDFEASKEGSEIMFRKMRSSNREYYKKVRYSKKTGEDVDFEEDFFAEKQASSRITPEHIVRLEEGQIFVFGSDMFGQHDGGAAQLALERFGAVFGQASGLQGQSYAIPTNGVHLEDMAKYIDEFIRFADRHPEMTFLVTRIGCGVAGYTDEQIAPLFACAYGLPNVFLPATFWKVLSYRYNL